MQNIIQMLQNKVSLDEVNAALAKWHAEVWSEELSEDAKTRIADRVTRVYNYGKTFNFSIDTNQHMWDWDLNRVINGCYSSYVEASDYTNNLDKLTAYAIEQGYDNVIPSYGPSIEYMQDVYFNLANTK